jgi:hypothetical protein
VLHRPFEPAELTGKYQFECIGYTSAGAVYFE